MRQLALIGGVVVPMCLMSGVAAADEPYGVRGTLTAVEADKVSVMNEDEEAVEVGLSDETEIYVVSPAKLQDVEPGQFVGITSVESGGERVALEVHIFAEDLRGLGEGHYAWDLVSEPNMMTNATVAEVREVGSNRQLRVTYKEGEDAAQPTGEQTVLVPDFADVVFLEKSADRSVLKVDQGAFLLVENTGQELPTALGVVVGQKGAIPPM